MTLTATLIAFFVFSFIIVLIRNIVRRIRKPRTGSDNCPFKKYQTDFEPRFVKKGRFLTRYARIFVKKTRVAAEALLKIFKSSNADFFMSYRVGFFLKYEKYSREDSFIRQKISLPNIALPKRDMVERARNFFRGLDNIRRFFVQNLKYTACCAINIILTKARRFKRLF